MPPHTEVPSETIPRVAIRFAGDSGDGMQLTGGQFTSTSALLGNDFATFPDFPAEIRAPRGTTFGVSGFQVHFANENIHTPGDIVNALVAMNPAAFKVHIVDVEPGGIVIVNSDEFTKGNLKKAGYEAGYNPLEDEDLVSQYRLFEIPMSRMTRESLAGGEESVRDIDRCRNMYALGIAYWLYNRPLDATLDFFDHYLNKQKKRPDLAALNAKALKAGYYFGETAELFATRYDVAPAKMPPGTYRKIAGNEAAAIGFVTAAQKAGKQLVYAGYPITPASDLMHALARYKQFDVKMMQAEDEIGAVCCAIGASFAGALGMSGTSGPGMALKAEAMALAVILELPLVVVDVQRAGPSTGMPTKTEQADLLTAMYGRPGEAPVVVVAPQSPADCFAMAIEAVRLAVHCMCPVIYLSDASLATGAEPWLIPDLESIPAINIEHPTAVEGEKFEPYARDIETLARPWAIPGQVGLEHRLGGLEKDEQTGNVSYDPENHDNMIRLRAEKVARAASVIPPLVVEGVAEAKTLVLGWGGTYGSIATAAQRLDQEGIHVARAHLRYLNPMPANIEQVLRKFDQIIVPEINTGQLAMLLRARYLVDVESINHIRGRSFQVGELVDEIKGLIKDDCQVKTS